jgi:hypothetical protein
MKELSLGADFFEWTGPSEVLITPYWKVNITSPAMVVSVNEDGISRGLVLLSKVEAVVDTIVPTSKGAFGNTTIFNGTNLVILGLKVTDINDSLSRANPTIEESSNWREEAEAIITKLQKRVKSHDINFKFNGDEDFDYIIFGRRNFLLVGGSEKFVLIHRKQIAVRSGEEKLVQIDPEDGILVANKNDILNLGGYASKFNLGGILGEFGITIASSVLDHMLWD